MSYRQRLITKYRAHSAIAAFALLALSYFMLVDVRKSLVVITLMFFSALSGYGLIYIINDEIALQNLNFGPNYEHITELVQNCSIPVISAGGVGDKKSLQRIMDLGASGVQMGTRFLATPALMTQELSLPR